ncbi:MAG: hypothetical protein GX493_03910 [Firmicutes bacterium]|nr:hypothetical protein [Bacillota bacterium]
MPNPGQPPTTSFVCDWDDGNGIYWTEFGGDWRIEHAAGSKQLVVGSSEDALFLANQTRYT